MASHPAILLFHGETIGRFSEGSYETPWFHFCVVSLDPTHGDRLRKVSAYERGTAPFEDASEEVYDAKADALLAQLDLTEAEAFMYSRTLRVLFDDGSLHEIGPAYFEDDILSFRVGAQVT